MAVAVVIVIVHRPHFAVGTELEYFSFDIDDVSNTNICTYFLE